MKKVLLATTVLAMSAGFAAAEDHAGVKVGGDARMGVVQNFKAVSTDKQKLSFTSRIRIKFTAAGEGDSGLSFGGSVRANDAVNGAVGTKGTVYISGAFGKLSMGDVDSAANTAVGHVDGVGFTALGDKNEIRYLGVGAKPAALYGYTMGDAGIWASVTQPSHTTATAEQIAYAVGANYKFGDFKVGAGYEMGEDKLILGGAKTEHTNIVVGGSASVAGATLKAVYALGETKPATSTKTKYNDIALSAAYNVSDVTVTGFVRMNTVELATKTEKTIFGLGASYDLGGGAKVLGGYVQDNTKNGLETGAFDFGVALSF